MIRFIIEFIKEFFAIKKHIQFHWHFWINDRCLFCVQTHVQVDNSRLNEKWRCQAIKWTRSLVNDRVSYHLKGRIIACLGNRCASFVGIKAWLQLPLWERIKFFIKRHLR